MPSWLVARPTWDTMSYACDRERRTTRPSLTTAAGLYTLDDSQPSPCGRKIGLPSYGVNGPSGKSACGLLMVVSFGSDRVGSCRVGSADGWPSATDKGETTRDDGDPDAARRSTLVALKNPAPVVGPHLGPASTRDPYAYPLCGGGGRAQHGRAMAASTEHDPRDERLHHQRVEAGLAPDRGRSDRSRPRAECPR